MFQALPFLTDPAATSGAHALGSFGAISFSLDGLAAFARVVSVAWAGKTTGVLPCVVRAWLAAGGAMTIGGFVVFFVWTLALSGVFLRQKRG